MSQDQKPLWQLHGAEHAARVAQIEAEEREEEKAEEAALREREKQALKWLTPTQRFMVQQARQWLEERWLLGGAAEQHYARKAAEYDEDCAKWGIGALHEAPKDSSTAHLTYAARTDNDWSPANYPRLRRKEEMALRYSVVQMAEAESPVAAGFSFAKWTFWLVALLAVLAVWRGL